MSQLTSPPPDASATTLSAPPGLSAAEALAATQFFSELSAVDLEQARPLAFAYPAFVLFALVASIPYCRWLGLIT